MRKLATGGYAVLLVLLVAAPAVASQAAAPQYQSSEPSDGATVHQPPDRVEITFDQPLDQSSTVTVLDGCDRRVDDGATEVSGNSMSVALKQKPSGRYHVEYLARGLASLTGENEGHFTFTAHGGPSCGEGGGGHKGHEDGDGDGHDGKNHGDGGHDGGGHDGTDHSSTTDHSGTDHSSTDGSAHSGDHDASGSGSHGNGGHSGGGHDDHPVAADARPFDGITSSDTERGLLTRADSTTLLISLALCVALGIVGGAVLRATNAK